MTELLTAAQMRAIEAAAIASGEVTGLELMERAGRGTVEAILAEWPELAEGDRRAVVLCGPGNNGGDGFVVARLLRERGWAAAVTMFGDASALPPAARASYEKWREGGHILDMADVPTEISWPGFFRLEPARVDLIIDAVFGIGQCRSLPEVVRGLLTRVWIRESLFCDHRVAIDVPTGVSSETGRTLPAPDRAVAAFNASLTVTYHRPKVGHFLSGAPAFCGTLRTVDIGLGSFPFGYGHGEFGSLNHDALAAAHGVAPRDFRADRVVSRLAFVHTDSSPSISKRPSSFELPLANQHKFDHGHALVLSGGVGRGGAARMAARGALRIGAGLVTLGCPPAAVIENAAQLDAIMLRPVRDAEALDALLGDDRMNALCLGPGLGTGEREAALVRAALGDPARGDAAPGSTRGLGRPGASAEERRGEASLGRAGAPEGRGPGSGTGASDQGDDSAPPDIASPDAAGRGRGVEGGAPAGRAEAPKRRRAVVLDGDALTILARAPDLLALLHERCVLTPHAGEFARLFPDIADRLDAFAEEGPAYSKVDATREAAARAGCVVLLKGPDTVIAHPGGRAAINSAHYERAAPWLATAGAGDVLAGFIAGLLARGFGPMDAANAAAWLHVECALEFGPGLIAEDLPEQLPKVLRRLGA